MRSHWENISRRICPPRPRSFPTLFHNPLHDLESIWWICIWGVCLHYIQEDPVQERLQAQL
ncbi:hypothetical protein C8Q75DRAFT_743823, partial [Abortiporus biennis]